MEYKPILRNVKAVFVLIFLSLYPIIVWSDTDDFTLLKTFEDITGFVAPDPLGNIFFISNGSLYKHHPLEGETLSYSRSGFGPVTHVDVSDPLNILVFFADFGNIVLLDKNLTQKQVIEGRSLLKDDLPQSVSHSSHSGFWAYFPNVYKIARFTNQGKPELVSQDLSREYSGLANVLRLTEHRERLFLYANGIWVFDLFANLLFTIYDIQTPDFQLVKNKIFYLKDNKLHAWDFFLEQENVFLLPESDVHTFYIPDNHHIFLQTDDALKKYRFTRQFFN